MAVYMVAHMTDSAADRMTASVTVRLTASVAFHVADSTAVHVATCVAVHMAANVVVRVAGSAAVQMASIVVVHAPGIAAVCMTASVTSGLFVGFVAGTVACCLLGSKITMAARCRGHHFKSRLIVPCWTTNRPRIAHT